MGKVPGAFVEIERKFLVTGDDWPRENGARYRQGYLNSDKARSVRVRVGKGKGYLTIKGETRGATRLEFEYEIPADEANALLARLCERPLIEKTRYEVAYRGLTWEVDEFYGDNEGLVIAEVELASEAQPFEKPTWVGQEVTGEARYYNVNLAKRPYKTWGASQPEDGS